MDFRGDNFAAMTQFSHHFYAASVGLSEFDKMYKMSPQSHTNFIYCFMDPPTQILPDIEFSGY